MVAEEFYVSCYNFNPIKSKRVIFKVSYKTSRSRSWSRNSDLRLYGAGAERNILGSTTLVCLVPSKCGKSVSITRSPTSVSNPALNLSENSDPPTRVIFNQDQIFTSTLESCLKQEKVGIFGSSRFADPDSFRRIEYPFFLVNPEPVQTKNRKNVPKIKKIVFF